MTSQETALKSFRWPQLAIGRFVARRNLKTAAIWALIFGIFVAGKAAGYASAYPTVQSRAAITASFGNNIGLAALFGAPHKITSVAGFTVWNTLNVMVIIGSIWAFLLVSRVFRGDEQAGRWELLLSGPTTARRATLNALGGLSVALGVLYIVAAAAFTLAGRLHTVNFSFQAALFFALAAVAGAAMFMSVGALASQLMPTRSRAAGFSAILFIAFFLLRALADTTTARWLLDISPLGWVEKLQPLYGSQPVWLLPIGLFIFSVLSVTVWLAGRRDLGDSLVADRDSAKAHLRFLKSPFGLAWRLNRASSLSWLAGVLFLSFFFGILTKSAVQAFSQSGTASRVFERVSRDAQAINTLSFLSVVFFLLMPLLMAYTVSAVGRMREDEAEGFLDNLLVRKISRYRWLAGRLSLIILVLAAGGLLGGLGAWIGVSLEHLGIAYGSLFGAGLNAAIPALFTLAVAALALAFLPRLTSTIGYSLIGWSFLLQILSSGLNLSHWILDTSVLYHVKLAPGVAADWRTNWIMVAISIILIAISAFWFNNRDLQNE